MTNSNPIGILGCGWLGQALAINLISSNHQVKGTTTNLNKLGNLTELGIEAYQIDLKPESIKGNIKDFLDKLEVLIIAIPPQFKNQNNNLFKSLQLLFTQYDLSKIKKLIYISSTGVFADGEDSIYDENSQPNHKSERGKFLLKLEQLIQAQNQVKHACILRYAGLIEHNGRHPIHFLSGKSNVKNPQAPVNLIERKDAVDLLLKIIKSKEILKVYHGVNPSHPKRYDYYTEKASKLKLQKPNFDYSEKSKGKIILSDLTQKSLNFRYKMGI